ncbi:MAG: hypothetical protein ACERKX_13880 [Anaerolineales bacterium]
MQEENLIQLQKSVRSPRSAALAGILFSLQVGTSVLVLRTGAISGYIGKDERLAEAIADFAEVYADHTKRDRQALVEAIEAGQIEVQTGI